LNKIVDWCPFKSQIIEKVEKEQNNMIRANDRRYVLIPMNVWIYLESLRVCMVVVTELFFHSFIITKSKSKKSLNQYWVDHAETQFSKLN
jgi:hypothetical protein